MPGHEHSEEPRASRQGVVEYVIVLALFALAAVGAVAVFGDNIRALFGIGPPHAAAPASVSAPAPK